jgi:hypothetical protein
MLWRARVMNTKIGWNKATVTPKAEEIHFPARRLEAQQDGKQQGRNTRINHQFSL